MPQAKPEPPNDLSVEKKLVGSILLAPSCLDQVMTLVQPSDFYYANLGALYAAACDLSLDNRPVTVATLASAAGVSNAEVANCLEGALGAESAFWAGRILHLRRLRLLLDAGTLATNLALSETEDIDAAFEKVENLLQTDASDGDAFTDLVGAGDTLLERYDRYLVDPSAISGLSTGWRYFDLVLDGLKPGEVSLVYAFSSHYKSLFVQNIAYRVAMEGRPVLMFTTEMPKSQVLERLVQIDLGLLIGDLRKDGTFAERYEEIKESVATIAHTYPLYINDRSVLDIHFLKAAVMRARRSHNVELVVVDLIDHVVSHRQRESSTASEAYVMQQLKDLAKQAGLHVMVTAHIDKGHYEDRKESSPRLELSRIKGATAKFQDADIALSLVIVARGADFRYKAATREERDQMVSEGFVYLMGSIQKNRSGTLRDVPFRIDVKHGMQIQSVDKEPGG